jgi:hypothetical protein
MCVGWVDGTNPPYGLTLNPSYEESKKVRYARRRTAPANRIRGLEESSRHTPCLSRIASG